MREQVISVNIGDRPYRLTVGSENEEQLFREAKVLIDKKMKQYASHYAYKDSQDLLAMVALQLAVESLNISKTSSYYQTFKDKLRYIDETLTDILKD